LKVQRLTLREIRMPLVTPFETSFGRVTDRRMLLVEVDADGVAGWGESVAGEGPFYAPETVETAWHILRDFIWPLLKGRDFESAEEVWTSDNFASSIAISVPRATSVVDQMRVFASRRVPVFTLQAERFMQKNGVNYATTAFRSSLRG